MVQALDDAAQIAVPVIVGVAPGPHVQLIETAPCHHDGSGPESCAGLMFRTIPLVLLPATAPIDSAGYSWWAAAYPRNELPLRRRLADTRSVRPALELVAVIIFPTAAAYAVIGGFRAFRWYSERRDRNRPVTDRADRAAQREPAAAARGARSGREPDGHARQEPSPAGASRAPTSTPCAQPASGWKSATPPGRQALPRPKSTGSSRPCGSVGWMSGRRRRAERGGSAARDAVSHTIDAWFVSSPYPMRSTKRLCANVSLAGEAELIVACGDLPFDYLGLPDERAGRAARVRAGKPRS